MAAPLQTDCLIRTSILIDRNIPYNNCCNDNPLNYGIIFYTSLFQAPRKLVELMPREPQVTLITAVFEPIQTSIEPAT